jgi:hypothetical protein
MFSDLPGCKRLTANPGCGDDENRGYLLQTKRSDGQMTDMTLQTLMEAGVHFGHQAKRWKKFS